MQAALYKTAWLHRGLAVAGLVLAAVGCSTEPTSKVLRLAVTTSTRDSGLLDQILPRFELQHSVRVDVLAVGTGAALKLGEAGDVDVILSHAKEKEIAFLDAGHAIRREPIMTNKFVLLGPATDPALVQGLDPGLAFQRIREKQALFVSRGDQSGTHLRELVLWGYQPDGAQPDGQPDDGQSAGGSSVQLHDVNVLETGQGMGASLVIADEQQAYILSDRGTYLKFEQKISLVPLVEDGPQLENAYAVLVINPDKNDKINSKLAEEFVEYLLAADTQQAIGAYRVSGEALFSPSRL